MLTTERYSADEWPAKPDMIVLRSSVSAKAAANIFEPVLIKQIACALAYEGKLKKKYAR